MTISTMERKLFKILKIFLIALFWLGIWWLVSLIIGKPLLFPSPFDVIKKLFELIITREFWKITLLSLCRVGLGILIAIVLGTLIGLLCSFSKIAYDVISPFVTVVKSTPVASFIILIWVFISSSITPVVISALMVFPIVFANVYQGVKSVDRNLVEVSKIYKIKRKKLISTFYIPSIMPYFSSALLSSIGLGWKAGIAAEVLCTPKLSIGLKIFEAKTYLENVELFAWTLSVIVISLIFEILITKLLKILLKKFIKSSGGSNENKKSNKSIW